MLHLLRTELPLPRLPLPQPLLLSDVFAFAITIWAPGDLVAFQLLAKMSSAAAARRAMCVRNICEATPTMPPTLPLPASWGSTGWPTQRSHATLLTLYTAPSPPALPSLSSTFPSRFYLYVKNVRKQQQRKKLLWKRAKWLALTLRRCAQ